jgi:hypothetical protein
MAGSCGYLYIVKINYEGTLGASIKIFTLSNSQAAGK